MSISSLRGGIANHPTLRGEPPGVRGFPAQHGGHYQNKVILVLSQAQSSLSSWPPPSWSESTVRAMARTLWGTGGFGSTVFTANLPLNYFL